MWVWVKIRYPQRLDGKLGVDYQKKNYLYQKKFKCDHQKKLIQFLLVGKEEIYTINFF